MEEKEEKEKEAMVKNVVATPTSTSGTPQLRWASGGHTNLSMVKLDDLNAFPALTPKTTSSRASTVTVLTRAVSRACWRS